MQRDQHKNVVSYRVTFTESLPREFLYSIRNRYRFIPSNNRLSNNELVKKQMKLRLFLLPNQNVSRLESDLSSQKARYPSEKPKFENSQSIANITHSLLHPVGPILFSVTHVP